jgi:hypothetical protein
MKIRAKAALNLDLFVMVLFSLAGGEAGQECHEGTVMVIVNAIIDEEGCYAKNNWHSS